MIKMFALLMLCSLSMAMLVYATEPAPGFAGRRGDYPAVRMARLQTEPVLVAIQQDPEPRHDKYRDDPHAACVTPAVAEHYKNPSLHACRCELVCTMGAGGYMEQAENQTCELYCTKERCACHPEEPCVEPEVPKR